MQYYQEITILPNAEIGLGFLWKKVFTQVHLALVEASNRNVSHGVSFPKYGSKEFPLGNKLRVFSPSEGSLAEIDLPKWLSRLSDYCHVTSIKEVPQDHGHVQFQRKQFKSNPERLARRRAKRKGESFEEALQQYAGFEQKKTNLPFIRLNSLSGKNKNEFPLFIQKAIKPALVEGRFSCYGLSDRATVPDFD